MATWYLTELGESEGVEALRAGIQRYNDGHGVDQTPTAGYHDSFTVFFARGIAAFLDELPAALDFEKRCVRVYDYFSDFRALATGYYSEEVFESWAARTTWIEPDAKPLSEWLESCRKAARE